MRHDALYAVLDPCGIAQGDIRDVRRTLLNTAKTLDLAGEREALHGVRLALVALDDAQDSLSASERVH